MPGRDGLRAEGGAVDEQSRPHELLRRTFLRLVGASGLAVVGSRVLTSESPTLVPVSAPTIGDPRRRAMVR